MPVASVIFSISEYEVGIINDNIPIMFEFGKYIECLDDRCNAFCDATNTINSVDKSTNPERRNRKILERDFHKYSV